MECTYTIPLPSSALTVSALPKLGIEFDKIYQSVVDTTLEIFAEHNSASVQATLYIMAEKVLKDNKHVSKVHYELPNKVSNGPYLSGPRITDTDRLRPPKALHSFVTSS